MGNCKEIQLCPYSRNTWQSIWRCWKSSGETPRGDGNGVTHLRGLDPSAWEGLGRLSLRWCGLAVVSWWEHVETDQIGDEFLRKALMAIHGRPRKLGLCKTWYRMDGRWWYGVRTKSTRSSPMWITCGWENQKGNTICALSQERLCFPNLQIKLLTTNYWGQVWCPTICGHCPSRLVALEMTQEALAS